MKEQILNLTEKEELAVLQAAKQIKKRKIAEKNKALAETLAKSYERERKEKVLGTLGCKKGHIKRSMVMFFNNPVAKDSLFERFSELQLGYKPRQPC